MFTQSHYVVLPSIFCSGVKNEDIKARHSKYVKGEKTSVSNKKTLNKEQLYHKLKIFVICIK